MQKTPLFLHKLFESVPLSLVEIEYEQWLRLPETIPSRPIKRKPLEQKKSEWLSMSALDGLSQHLHLVFLVKLDNDLFRINGRVRQLLWEEEELTPPQTLTALIYQLNLNEALALTNAFYPVHTKARVKMGIIDFYQELGLSFQSPRLKSGLIAEMLNIALRGKPAHLLDRRTYPPIDLKRAIALFKKELLLLDQLQLDTALFPTGVLAAAMIFLSLDKNHIEFFRHYNEGSGVTQGKNSDPMAALTKMVHYLKTAPGSQYKIQVELCAKTANCVLSYQRGRDDPRFWTKQLRNVEIKPHILKMRRVKGIIGDRQL